MELEKIVLLPIPTGWRDSNSPMGDGLSTINGVLQNLSLIWAVTSTVLGALTKFDVFWKFYILCLWSEKNRFTTHFNGLEGLQQSHGQYPTNHQWFVTNIVDQKCTYWTKRVFTPYWKKNLSSARRREDQMMTNFVKHHWWLIGHHPWDCWSPSNPLEWVVKRFFSTPWQNKIEKRPKFKSYFICKMALKPPKVETGIQY